MTISEVGTVAAIIVSAFSALLAYRGSDRASARSTEAQREANAASGFQLLTQEQRTELTDARQRAETAQDEAHEAREQARAANERAARADVRAHKAETAAERCQTIVAQLTVAYRELYEYATSPCPHVDPPPPPIRILSMRPD